MYNCASLALTSLPDGLNSIGESAFYNCASLALTSLPDGLTSIGDEASFYGCHRCAVTRHSLPPTERSNKEVKSKVSQTRLMAQTTV